MKGEKLLKVWIGRICSCAILLLCAACSREQEEIDQALCADQEEAVAQVSGNSDFVDLQDGQDYEGPDDLYKDPYANPNAKVEQQISESFEPAERHKWRYSVRSYEFKGKGPAHKMVDVSRPHGKPWL